MPSQCNGPAVPVPGFGFLCPEILKEIETKYEVIIHCVYAQLSLFIQILTETRHGLRDHSQVSQDFIDSIKVHMYLLF